MNAVQFAFANWGTESGLQAPELAFRVCGEDPSGNREFGLLA